MYCSYGNAYRLTGNNAYRDILIQSAKSLCTRFNKTAGSIKSWNKFVSWHGNKTYDFPVIIDNMMNLELLFFASKQTGDPVYKEIAIKHAETAMKNQIREDYSSFHVVCYDTLTGKVLGRETAQGYADNSTWSRGQAWGIYGFTMVYRETKDPRFLKTAMGMADWYLNSKTLPKDKVPYWDFNTLDEAKWKQSVVDTYEAENGELCIYIHLPFCENMCTFCACNKRITVNHAVEDPYIASVLKEWKMYRALLKTTPVIKEIHLGGGTPTFFSPDNLTKLINGITENVEVSKHHEFSIEVHPNYTTEAHIKALADVGFNRVSLGVQDFDPHVQFVINRIQSFEKTKEVVEWARKYHFTSINIDLVYGLPHQTVASVEHTIGLIKGFMPDRIAFYSYAHVPWTSKVQRRYSEVDLPTASEKWAGQARSIWGGTVSAFGSGTCWFYGRRSFKLFIPYQFSEL
jgi:hypothetical protein